MKTRNAVIYTRVSTGMQAEHGTSLSDQLAVCQKKLKELNANTIAIYEDPGVSGSLYVTRPGIQAALADIEAGRADTLVIAKLDRSGRDVDAVRDIAKRVSDAGGQFIICDIGVVEWNSRGKIDLTMRAAFAEWEKDQIRERTMGGRRRRAQEGRQPSRTHSPYGYHIVNHKDVLNGLYKYDQVGLYVVLEEQAKWVREIYSRYAGGNSLQQVCKWLNDSSVPTPRQGRYWASATVKLILQNEVYKGTPVFGKWQRVNDESRPSKGFKRTFTQRVAPAEDKVYLSCDALVEAVMWNYCQTRLSEARSRFSGRPTRKYLLSGLLSCPKCGKGMAGSYDKKKDYIRYRCREAMKSRASGHPCCIDRTYNGETAHSFVIKGLRGVVERPELIERAEQAWTAEAFDAVQNWGIKIDRLQKEMSQLAAKERLTVEGQLAAVSVGGSPEVYLTMLREINQKRVGLTAQLREAEAMSARKPEESVAVTITEILAALDEALFAPEIGEGERHDLLARVVQKVVPNEDGYYIHLARLPGMETVNSVFTTWDSRQDFLNWVRSEAFVKGHAQSGTLPKDAYPQPNVLEMHEVVTDSSRPDMTPEPPGGPFKMH